MGFTKLDSNIIQSSIMSEPAVVFKVWIALLASCGPDGIARVSSTFLAGACYMDLETVDRALGVLEAPDARSRSLNEDGRRIRRVDGGYFIINYEKYRGFTPQEGNPDSPGAIRVRRWREKHKAVTGVTEGVTEGVTKSADVTLRNVTTPPVVTQGNVTSVTSASASCSKEDSEEGKSPEKGPSLAATVTAVVVYLNEKTGKRFSPKSSDTTKHISARINEGRTLDDFKRVIDVKCAKWKGKTWQDTRPGREGQPVHGDDFLCPATLFCAKNFETYLNESGPARAETAEDYMARHKAEMAKLNGKG